MKNLLNNLSKNVLIEMVIDLQDNLTFEKKYYIALQEQLSFQVADKKSVREDLATAQSDIRHLLEVIDQLGESDIKEVPSFKPEQLDEHYACDGCGVLKQGLPWHVERKIYPQENYCKGCFESDPRLLPY